MFSDTLGTTCHVYVLALLHLCCFCTTWSLTVVRSGYSTVLHKQIALLALHTLTKGGADNTRLRTTDSTEKKTQPQQQALTIVRPPAHTWISRTVWGTLEAVAVETGPALTAERAGPVGAAGVGVARGRLALVHVWRTHADRQTDKRRLYMVHFGLIMRTTTSTTNEECCVHLVTPFQ